MNIKTKVALGVAFLFAVIITVGGMGLYYLDALSRDANNILVNNYETLEYTKRIIQHCDSLPVDSAKAIASIEQNIQLQETHITEPGERELTHALRVTFEKLKNAGIDDREIVSIRKTCLAIQELNMRAIVRKHEVTQATAYHASNYLVIICSICILVAFTFIINFPGYVANPILQLTSSIKSIARKNYEERLHFDRNDEFEELAEAFNQMAEKLDEYEHSNLAKVIFEKKRTETIINKMSDPVIGLDEHNIVVFANDQALQLLNLTMTETIGHYAPDIALDNDLFRSLIRETMSGNDASLLKIVVAGAQNYFSKESINIQYTPTGEKDTMDLGRVILLRNITTYKERDLAKTNFIATISHELKTPIASLQMASKLLQDNRIGTLNDEQTSIVTTFTEEIQRLSRITHELLDLSQAETGNIRLTIRRTLSKDIVQRALDAIRFQAEQKHVTLTAAELADWPGVQADPDKSVWVLVNFLTNAIRYTPDHGHIIVTCKAIEKFVHFSVEDHGPGIDTKYIDKVFEKYYQVPGTASGSGLGLAVSKEFIEAQGGAIAVTSAIGKGSVFTFTLPLAS